MVDGERVCPVLVELGVLVVGAEIAPEPDLDDHHGTGQDPDGDPDRQIGSGGEAHPDAADLQI
jgi:hypothetical protein